MSIVTLSQPILLTQSAIVIWRFMNGVVPSKALRARIAELESQLQSTRRQLEQQEERESTSASFRPGDDTKLSHAEILDSVGSPTLTLHSTLHNLILLSDSALPLGSFAYSNGLESFLSHHKPLPPGITAATLLHKFLRLSIQSVTHTNVPYILKGFRNPASLLELDNDIDASTPCRVTRTASIAQGKALLSIWEKSLSHSARLQFPTMGQAHSELDKFSDALKISASTVMGVNGHLAPLWGVISAALGQNISAMAYLFLFNHAKAVLSAAIRANVIGPYSVQTVLAGQELQELIRVNLQSAWNLEPEDAGQVVPVMDLWVGRHELLYSRIFNS